MTKERYLKKFAKLRVDRAHGSVAPHKPILLLSVIDLMERSTIEQNQIFLSPELISTFLKYWSHLGSQAHRSDIALPFFHLTGDGFWHLAPHPGFESAIAAKIKLKNLSVLRSAVNYAYLDRELYILLQDVESRNYLLRTLVKVWFGEVEDEIENLFNVDAFQEFQQRLFEQGGAIYRVEDLEDEAKAIVRDAAFRNNIVSLYGQRCAFFGLRIISIENQNIVDGAHIKPFSEFRDDRFDNGLALCKNHHWSFDRGWFGISEDYRILIPPNRFAEEPPINTRSMKEFDREFIFLPSQAAYYPRLNSLHWHRQRWNIA